MPIKLKNGAVDTEARTIKGLTIDVDASGDDPDANALFDLIAKLFVDAMGGAIEFKIR